MAVERQRLHELWDSYRREVLPSNAPPIQFVECKRAFYSGAAALFEVLMVDLAPGDEITADDLQQMRSIQSELENFGLAVQTGRA